ncbi:hypothetical protein [Thaumasiovibrio subtropicus]|uniref:hypothetical protein n=1 Tax=Thaumasiovibrio subtropicus TaxID=1891207 RepID=UPI000B358CC9|nr:hypothetical protein [Thaumasiovibrio subtropicus]
MTAQQRYQQLSYITFIVIGTVGVVHLIVLPKLLTAILLTAWMNFPYCIVMAMLLHFVTNPTSPMLLHYALLIFWGVSVLVAFYCLISIVFHPDRIVSVSTMAPLAMLTIATPASVGTLIFFSLRKQSR